MAQNGEAATATLEGGALVFCFAFANCIGELSCYFFSFVLLSCLTGKDASNDVRVLTCVVRHWTLVRGCFGGSGMASLALFGPNLTIVFERSQSVEPDMKIQAKDH